MIKELLSVTRSYRRFDASKSIDTADLSAIVNAVRLSPSAANLQRVRVAIVNNNLQKDRIFSCLSFAAYLKDWQGPSVSERPAAYLVVLTEKEPDVNLAIDIGLASEAMILTAREMGIGACLFRSFKPDVLAEIINKPLYVPSLVIALGYPAEDVVIDEVKDGNVKYFRDENGVHHVPKLSLNEIIV